MADLLSEIFEKRRAAAARQSAYRRRRRLALIMVTLPVIAADLIVAGLARGLLLLKPQKAPGELDHAAPRTKYPLRPFRGGIRLSLPTLELCHYQGC